MQRSDGAPPAQLGPACRRPTDYGFIQDPTRNTKGRKRKLRADHLVARMDPDGGNVDRTKGFKIDAQVAKIEYSLAAYELAADFVVRAGFAFD